MTSAISDTQPIPAMTVRPAPRREPPFDDEMTERRLHVVGPADRPLPFPTIPSWSTRPATAPRSDSLPDPAAWGRRLLIGLLETFAGRRPPGQLAAHLSVGVANGLTREADPVARARTWGPRATIRSVRVFCPADGVAELAAVVQTGARCRAIAIRLEAPDGRWRCTRLQLG